MSTGIPAHGPRTSAPSATTTPNTPSYTPGPWREHSHRQIGPDVGIVCEVWSAIGWGDAAIREADANVHLIAAAPGAEDPHRRLPYRHGCCAPADDDPDPRCDGESRRRCSMIAPAIRRADHLDRPDYLARIVTPHGVILCERAVGGIAINPRLPADFDQTPNDDRPASHLKFWHRNYIVTETIARLDRFYSDRRDQWADQGRVWWRDQGRPAWLKAWPAGTCYTVRCLDGGAWDRSTNRGSYGSLSDALAAAGGRHA